MSLPKDYRYLGPECSQELLTKLKLSSKSPASQLVAARILNYHGFFEKEIVFPAAILEIVDKAEPTVLGCYKIIEACKQAQITVRDFQAASDLWFIKKHRGSGIKDSKDLTSDIHLHGEFMCVKAHESLLPVYIDILQILQKKKNEQYKTNAAIDDKLALSEIFIYVNKLATLAAGRTIAQGRIAVSSVPFESFKVFGAGKKKRDKHIANTKEVLLLHFKEKVKFYAIWIQNNLKDVYKYYELEALTTPDPMMHIYAKSLHLISDIQPFGKKVLSNHLDLLKRFHEIYSDEALSYDFLGEDALNTVYNAMMKFSGSAESLKFILPTDMTSEAANTAFLELQSAAFKKVKRIELLAEKRNMFLKHNILDISEETFEGIVTSECHKIMRSDAQTELTDASPATLLPLIDQECRDCYEQISGIRKEDTIAKTPFERFQDSVVHATDTDLGKPKGFDMASLLQKDAFEMKKAERSIECFHPYSRLFKRTLITDSNQAESSKWQALLKKTDSGSILRNILEEIPGSLPDTLSDNGLEISLEMLAQKFYSYKSEEIPKHLQGVSLAIFALGRAASISTNIGLASLLLRSYKSQPIRMQERGSLIQTTLDNINLQLPALLQSYALDAELVLTNKVQPSLPKQLNLATFIYLCYRHALILTINTECKFELIDIFLKETLKYSLKLKELIENKDLSIEEAELALRVSEIGKEIVTLSKIVGIEQELRFGHISQNEATSKVQQIAAALITIYTPDDKVSFTPSDNTTFDEKLNTLWFFIHSISHGELDQFHTPNSDFYHQFNKFLGELREKGDSLLERLEQLEGLGIYLTHTAQSSEALLLSQTELERYHDSIVVVEDLYQSTVMVEDTLTSLSALLKGKSENYDVTDEYICVHVIAKKLLNHTSYASSASEAKALELAIGTIGDIIPTFLSREILACYLDRRDGEKTLSDVKDMLTDGSTFHKALTRAANMVHLLAIALQRRNDVANIEIPAFSHPPINSDIEALSIPLLDKINELIMIDFDTLLTNDIFIALKNILVTDCLTYAKEKKSYSPEKVPECLRMKLYAPDLWKRLEPDSDDAIKSEGWRSLPLPKAQPESSKDSASEEMAGDLIPEMAPTVSISLKKKMKIKQVKGKKAKKVARDDSQTDVPVLEPLDPPTVERLTHQDFETQEEPNPPLPECLELPASVKPEQNTLAVDPTSIAASIDEDEDVGVKAKTVTTMVSEMNPAVKTTSSTCVDASLALEEGQKTTTTNDRAVKSSLTVKADESKAIEKPVLDVHKQPSTPYRKQRLTEEGAPPKPQRTRRVQKRKEVLFSATSSSISVHDGLDHRRKGFSNFRSERRTAATSSLKMPERGAPIEKTEQDFPPLQSSHRVRDQAFPPLSHAAKTPYLPKEEVRDSRESTTVPSPEVKVPKVASPQSKAHPDIIAFEDKMNKDAAIPEAKVDIVAASERPAAEVKLAEPKEPADVKTLSPSEPSIPEAHSAAKPVHNTTAYVPPSAPLESQFAPPMMHPSLMFQYQAFGASPDGKVKLSIFNATEFLRLSKIKLPLMPFSMLPQRSPGCWFEQCERYIKAKVEKKGAFVERPLAAIAMLPIKEALDRFDRMIAGHASPSRLAASTLVRLIRNKQLSLTLSSSYIRSLQDAADRGSFYQMNPRSIWMNYSRCINQLEQSIRGIQISALYQDTIFLYEDRLAQLRSRQIALAWLIPCDDSPVSESFVSKETKMTLSIFSDASEHIRTRLHELLSTTQDWKNPNTSHLLNIELLSMRRLLSTYTEGLYLMINSMQAYKAANPFPSKALTDRIDGDTREILAQAATIQRAQARITGALAFIAQLSPASQDVGPRL